MDLPPIQEASRLLEERQSLQVRRQVEDHLEQA
jgi:hypothetical protein